MELTAFDSVIRTRVRSHHDANELQLYLKYCLCIRANP
jgi:hypothetical protein